MARGRGKEERESREIRSVRELRERNIMGTDYSRIAQLDKRCSVPSYWRLFFTKFSARILATKCLTILSAKTLNVKLYGKGQPFSPNFITCITSHQNLGVVHE